MKGSSEHIQPILSAKSSDMEVVLKPRETDHAVVLRETPVRDTEVCYCCQCSLTSFEGICFLF